MRNRYLTLRLSDDLDSELNEALSLMESSLGVPSSKGFRVKMLIHMGIERLHSEGLLRKV
jgi:transcriptional regulatory protein LevR